MSRTPLWTAIAAALRDEITTGLRHPGEKIPTEAELATRFGVNRHTVRRALAELREAGLVHSQRGAGVFVTDAPPVEYPLGRRVRLHQNLAASGKVAGRQILSIDTRLADTREARLLELGTGARVHVCHGVSLANGLPIAVFRSALPAGRLPGFPALLEREGSITRALAACGISDYTRAWTRIDARPADVVQAGHLKLPEGAPLLRSTSLNHDPGGRPLEYGRTWFAGNRVTLTVAPDEGG